MAAFYFSWGYIDRYSAIVLFFQKEIVCIMKYADVIWLLIISAILTVAVTLLHRPSDQPYWETFLTISSTIWISSKVDEYLKRRSKKKKRMNSINKQGI